MTGPEDKESVEGRMKDLDKVFKQNDEIQEQLSQLKTQSQFNPENNRGCLLLAAWTGGLALAIATGLTYWFLRDVLSVVP